jgi:outer membrane receptor protein involved in Fe transport
LRQTCIQLFLLSVLATPLPAQTGADNEEPTKKPRSGETIVVTATRTERSVSELPISTDVVSEEEIETAPVVSIDDLLRTIPGVHMNLQGSTTHETSSASRISMRGLGGTRALVLLDGVPMHDPLFGTVEWHKVPMDRIEQVEVVRGGSAGLFGNYSLGGTINLITRPVDASGVRVDAAAGNMDTRRQSVNVDQMISERLGIRLSHTDFDSDGFITVPINEQGRVPAWSDFAVTSLRADYRASDTGRANLRVNWSDSEIGTSIVNSHTARTILDIAAGFQRSVGGSGLLLANAFHRATEERGFEADFADDGSPFLAEDIYLPRESLGGSVEWSTQLPGTIQFVTIGADFLQTEANEDTTFRDETGSPTSLRIVHGQQQFTGLFGQASWRPTDRFELLAAARFDSYRNIDGTEGTAGQPLNRYPTTTTTTLNPRVSFRYAFSSGFAMRGAVYRAFKAPSIRELYRSNRSGSTLVIGNPHLQPERLMGGEIGAEWAGGPLHLSMNLFRNEVDGLQVRAPVAGQPSNVLSPANLGRIRSQGLELMADAALGRGWFIEAAYIHADSKIIEDVNPALVGNLVPEVSPHVGTLSLRHLSANGTTVNIRGRILARAYGDSANRGVTPAHRVFDIFVSHPVREHLDAYVSVENVLDAETYYAISAASTRNGRPRGIVAGLRLDLPTGGVRSR